MSVLRYFYFVTCLDDSKGEYDTGASVASQVSGWHWNRLNFNSSVTSPAVVSVQPIRLSKI